MASPLAAFTTAFHAHFTKNPNRCVVLGVDERRGELPDPSLAAAEGDLAGARELLGQLDALEGQEGLGFDDRLDLDLARLSLDAQVHDLTLRFNGRSTLEQKPNAGDDIGEGIFMLYINDPAPAGERLEAVTSRLENVPAYLSSQRATLNTPVARWAKMDAEKCEGLSSLFDNVVEWGEREGFADTARLSKARDEAVRELGSHAAWLREQKTEAAFHLEAGDGEKLVKLRGIDLSFAELHRTATDYLREINAQIDELSSKLAARYSLPSGSSVEDVEKLLNERFKVQRPNGTLDDIVHRYEHERDKVLEFVQERQLFPIPEDQEMLIMRTPKFLEPTIPAGAMTPPTRFRPGLRRSIVYLTLSEDLLDEHTELGIPSMMVHEGIPGHHLQLSFGALHPSVIRRHQEPMEQAEGWTTMLEDYMLDVGYLGELTDEGRFVGKRDICRIGARVAIDLFFLTGDRNYLDVGVDCDFNDGDPFVAAGNLLQKVTGFTPGRVQAELNWYSQERGYPLSYLTGNRLVWQLKADVAAANRGELEGTELDRKFHRTFLEAGNMPVSFLRRVFEHEGLLG